MLGHEYEDMPGQDASLVLRCKRCYKTPSKARADGCAKRELDIVGKMQLSLFNPEGMGRFSGRICATCECDIMEHWLRNDGTMNYYCTEDGEQVSEGITDPVWDIPEGLGTNPERV